MCDESNEQSFIIKHLLLYFVKVHDCRKNPPVAMKAIGG